jgi:hypothetical protein
LHRRDDLFDGDVCDAEDAPFDFVNRHDVLYSTGTCNEVSTTAFLRSGYFPGDFQLIT